MQKKHIPAILLANSLQKYCRFLSQSEAKLDQNLDLYDVFNAVLHLLKTGCQWRALTREFPDYRRVHYYFMIWKDGEILNEVLKKISWRGPTKQWLDRQN